MKKHILMISVIAVFLICALLAGVLIYVDKTEWTLRPTEQKVSIPITISGTMTEIVNGVLIGTDGDDAAVKCFAMRQNVK